MTSSRQNGQALMSAIVGMSLVVLILVTALTFTQNSGKAMARQLTFQGQAHNTAVAGLADALSWFRRQTTQPVTTFNPQLNLAAIPPINDTENPAVGIVRTFSISDYSHLQGQYQVTIGSIATGKGTFDITTQTPSKMISGAPAGTVWQLESTGFVYLINDASKPITTVPNTLIAKQTVRTTIQSLTVKPPANSALFSRMFSLMTLNGGTKVQGGGNIGAAAPTGTGTPVGVTKITGSPATSTSANPYSIPAVFGVNQQELTGLADYNVNQVTDIPYTLSSSGVNLMPTMSLIVVNGTANFTAANPLNGSGVLVVFGDLNVASSTNSSFSGVIYCTGNVTINQPTIVSGAIIAAGNGASGGGITLNSSGDITEVDYDPNIITQVQQQLGQYRFSRSPYII